MGRNEVEATNAWRMRRTRGDMGRRLLLAAADRDDAVPVFLPGECGLANFAGGFEDGAFAGVWEVCEVEGLAAGSDFSGACAAATGVAGADVEDCGGIGLAAAPLRGPQNIDSASTHNQMKRNRTTLIIFRAGTRVPEPVSLKG